MRPLAARSRPPSGRIGRRAAPPRRPLSPLWAAVLLAAPPSLLAPPSTRAAEDSPPVATVGDTVLTVADLERTMRRRTGGRPVADEAAERASALTDLVEETVLRDEIARRGISPSEREVDDRMAALSQDLATRKSNLDAFLADQKLDRPALRRRLALDIAVGRLARELVTPEALARAHREHHREFDGSRVRVAHVILRPDGADGPRATPALEARAAAIRAAIAAGELSFEEAAARYSSGPSRHRGGDIGFIPRHGLLAEEFARACFALPPGDLSPPVATPFGVHLIKVLEVDEGSVAAEQFRPQLERLAAQHEIRELVRACRARTEITLEPGYEIAEPPSAPAAE